MTNVVYIYIRLYKIPIP